MTLSGTGANTYSWDNGITDGVGFPAPGSTTHTRLLVQILIIV